MQEKSLTTLQHKILKILLDETSEIKGITAHEILDRLGIAVFGGKNIKSLQVSKNFASVMDELRAKGFPICSSHIGYFYARRNETVRDFILKLQQKILPFQRTVELMEKTFQNVDKRADSFELKITLPVRTNNGVKYQSFEIDKNGKPIIPEGIEII